MGEQTLNDDLAPGLTRADYQAMASRLDLGKERREAADRVYEGYTAEHTREAATFKAALDRLGKTGHHDPNTGQWVQDPDDERAYDAALEKYHAFKPKAKAEAISDIKALLTDAEVAEKWPDVDRFVRRMLLRPRCCSTARWRGSARISASAWRT